MKRRPPATGPARAGLGLVFLGLFAAAVGSLLVSQLAPALARWIEPFSRALESAPEALARLGGREYAAAIGTLSRRIPVRAVYGLIDTVDLHGGGGHWVRYELAPRRPVYFGTLAQVREHPERAREFAGDGSWLVVADVAPEPPELWSAADLERWLERGDAP